MVAKRQAVSGVGVRVDLFVSVYGDGALLDATIDVDGDDLRRDDEGPTAILRLTGVPAEIAMAAVDYANGNMGPCPYSDGYEACECLAVAQSSEVVECDVPWSSDECKRLGGCFLCGGDHRD